MPDPLHCGDRVPLGARRSLDFQLSATYKSKQFLDSTNDPYTTQSDYWTADARVAITIEKLELAGFVRNLSNTYYATTSFNSFSPFGYAQPVYAPPRTYGVEGRITF